MKKIFLLSILGLILVSCNKEKEFDENLQKSYDEMTETILYSAIVCDNVSKTWSTAIHKNRDHKGNYCSDFNDALSTLYSEYYHDGTIDTIQAHKSRMEGYTSKLNNPPSNRKDCYDDYVEIVAEVSSFSRMATDPQGSLQSYNNQTNEAFENISKLIDRFKIKYGDYLKKEK